MSGKSAWFTSGIGAAALAFGLAFGLSIGPVALAQGEQPGMSREMQIANAKTKADHEALAAQYEQEAKDAKAKADEHRNMAQAYARAGFGEKFNLQAHCKKIAERYDEAAAEDLAMAKIHRELASKAK